MTSTTVLTKTKKFTVFEVNTRHNNDNDDNDGNDDNNGDDDDDDNELFYNKVCEDVEVNYDNARDISRSERESMNMEISRIGFLTYGEIPYQSMKQIFDNIKEMKQTSRKHHHFNLYDLGSGSGSSTLAALLQLPFHKAVGIEILQGLYQMSLNIKIQWNSIGKYDTILDFIHGSILDSWDWIEQDRPAIIFANSTCFNDEMFSKISQNSKLLPIGSYVITLSVPITTRNSNKIKLLKELRLEMVL